MERFGGFENLPDRRSRERRNKKNNKGIISLEDLRKENNDPETIREGIISSLEDLMFEIEDPFLREVINAILEKLYLKATIADLIKHRDDTSVYRKVKWLGIFIVVDTVSNHNFEDPKSDFHLAKGEPILDLHLPPIRPEDRTRLRERTVESLRLLAEYIRRHKLTPKYILGITYERLAKVAKRFGFTVIEIPIPQEIQRRIENLYKKLIETDIRKGKQPKPMGKIFLCYIKTEDLLEKFGKP